MAAPAQAERALCKAAEKGDLAALTRLVAEEANFEATGYVSAAPPARPHSSHPTLALTPSALTTRRASAAPPAPLCPHRASPLPACGPPPRLRSWARRPS